MDRATVLTYNRNPQFYAEKFAGIGPRIDDIDKVFGLVLGTEPLVVEFGCGDGRDAVEILHRTKRYIGVDISSGLLNIAKERVPAAQFVEADITDYEIPSGTNIVFAFASMLHCDKETNATILAKARDRLADGGAFRISLKKGKYQAMTIADEVGERLFFFYELNDILDISTGFELVESHETRISTTDWLEVTLRKS